MSVCIFVGLRAVDKFMMLYGRSLGVCDVGDDFIVDGDDDEFV